MRPHLLFFCARCVQLAQQVVFMDHLRSRMYLCPVLVARALQLSGGFSERDVWTRRDRTLDGPYLKIKIVILETSSRTGTRGVREQGVIALLRWSYTRYVRFPDVSPFRFEKIPLSSNAKIVRLPPPPNENHASTVFYNNARIPLSQSNGDRYNTRLSVSTIRP